MPVQHDHRRCNKKNESADPNYIYLLHLVLRAPTIVQLNEETR